jgi:large subunit ribosomal protein L6
LLTFIKMKKPFEQTIEIPEGIEISLDDSVLKIKGPEGENSREFKLGKIKFEIKDNKITLNDKKATKREKKMINTTASHIQNMIKGVQEKFVYTLKVASSHFPMTVKLEGDKAEIKNFLGEKISRYCSIPKGAEVEVKKNDITVKSVDKEIAGQAAANFEKATRISNRDRRIFQDGVYITNKAGKEM